MRTHANIAMLCAEILTAPLAVRHANAATADEALDLYKRGVELYNLERYVDAAEAFRGAHALRASWKLYYNIGQAEAAARRYGLALDAFEAYLVQGGDNIPEERRNQIIEEIKGFKVLVGTIEVDAPDGSELFVDGKLRGTIPLHGVLRVAAGVHHFLLRNGAAPLVDKNLRIAGEVNTVIRPEEEAGAVSPATDPGESGAIPTAVSTARDDSRMSGKTIAGLVTAAAGVAGVTVGAVFIARSRDDFDKAEAQEDRDAYRQWERVFHRDNAIGIAGLAVGGALVATGVVLVILGVGEKTSANADDEISLRPAAGGLSVTF